MKSYTLFALAAGAFAQQNNIRVDFSQFNAEAPASTNPTLVGVGSPVSPNPFEGLGYSDEFRVVALERNSLLKIPTPPNVLVAAGIQAGSTIGTFSKTDADKYFTLKGFSWTCVQENGTAIVPVPCSVNIIGVQPTNIGSLRTERVVSAGGRRPFQRSKVLINHLLNATFILESITLNGTGAASFVLDNLNYWPVAGSGVSSSSTVSSTTISSTSSSTEVSASATTTSDVTTTASASATATSDSLIPSATLTSDTSSTATSTSEVTTSVTDGIPIATSTAGMPSLSVSARQLRHRRVRAMTVM